MAQRTLTHRDPVRTTLWLDAAIEAVVALCLLVARAPLADWLPINTTACLALAGVFALAAVAIGALALSPSRRAVRALAWANILGGALLWLLLIGGWGSLEPPGRWLLGATGDTFILIGVLELFALARTR